MSFLHSCCFLLSYRQLTIDAWVFLCTFCPVPLVYITVSVPVSHCHHYCSFAISPDIRELDSFSCFSFTKLLWLFGVLFFYTNCKILCKIQCYEECHLYFDRVYIESVDFFESYTQFLFLHFRF